MPIQITINSQEFWLKQEKRMVTIPKDVTITMEHSLISISKWEEKWHHAYYSKKHEKTREEIYDYLRCMTIGKPLPLDWYKGISSEEMKRLTDYIKDPHSALVISSRDSANVNPNTVTTSEHIYYAMIAYNIPHEYETWHLNRLLNFIKLCKARSQTKDKRHGYKMSEADHLDRIRRNEERCKQIGSKG